MTSEVMQKCRTKPFHQVNTLHSLAHSIHSTRTSIGEKGHERWIYPTTAIILKEMDVIACIDQNDNPSWTMKQCKPIRLFNMVGQTTCPPLFISLGFHIDTEQRSVGSGHKGGPIHRFSLIPSFFLWFDYTKMKEG